MPLGLRIARFVVTFALLAAALGISARAQAWSCVDPATAQNQICTYNPVNGSTVTSTPVWLKAVVNSCAFSNNIIAFGYSINNEYFWNQGKTNFDIDTTDYRLMPGGTYTVWFKAWSDQGACDAVPITVTVDAGPAWNVLYENVNAFNNATLNGSQWQVPPCPYPENQDNSGPYRTWYWNYDAGTAPCTESNVNSTNTSNANVSPTFDGQSRAFYVTWTAWDTGFTNPGERYSIWYADNTTGAQTATNFVYDEYFFLAPGPDVNIATLQMDMNQVAAILGNNDLIVYGLECVSSVASTSETRVNNPPPSAFWKYTTTQYPYWQPTTLDCTQLFIPNMWHHVQLKAHTNGSGGAYYDSITLDGTTTLTPSWFGNSSTSVQSSWPIQLFLNFQIDGMHNNGNPATALVIVDGMTMIWW